MHEMNNDMSLQCNAMALVRVATAHSDLFFKNLTWKMKSKQPVSGIYKHYSIMFIYSEKDTKFCKIFTLLLTTVHTVKSKVKISQNFVAFSEYMNFKIKIKSVNNFLLFLRWVFFSFPIPELPIPCVGKLKNAERKKNAWRSENFVFELGNWNFFI